MQADKQVSQQQSEHGAPKKAIRILSIDGGGIRGVAVAELLHGIETEMKKPIHELFDVIVGTSTGGLLAVMMSVEIPPVPEGDHDTHIHTHAKDKKVDPKKAAEKRKRQIEIREKMKLKPGQVLTAEQARDLYKMNAKDIFHEDASFLHKLFDKNFIFEKLAHLTHTKYEKGENLKKIVQALYIKNSFAQARTCTGVVVTERGFGMPVLLNSTNAKVQGCHNYHNNLSLGKLVRATSAAPTYFKAVHIHNPVIHRNEFKHLPALEAEEKLIKASQSLWDPKVIDHKFCERKILFFEDGGVTCNNPSLKGFRYAKELLKLHGHNPYEYQFQIYSLGTGAEKYNQIDPAAEIIKDLEKQGGKVKSGYSDTLRRLVTHDPFDINRQSYKNHHKIQQRLMFFEKKTKIDQKYFRLQFKLEKKDLEKMDDSSDKFMSKLIKSAQNCMDLDPKIGNSVWKDLLACLREEVQRPEGLNKVLPNIKPEDSTVFACPLNLHKGEPEACDITSQEQ